MSFGKFLRRRTDSIKRELRQAFCTTDRVSLGLRDKCICKWESTPQEPMCNINIHNLGSVFFHV